MINKCTNSGTIDFQSCFDSSIICKSCKTTITKSYSSMATIKDSSLGNNLSSGRKSILASILLAFFLGDFRGQYFYSGKYAENLMSPILLDIYTGNRGYYSYNYLT